MAILAIRYNNPGNVSLPITGYNGGGTIVGAQGQAGYGSFPDMQSGFQAMQTQLGNYIDGKGLNTISALNSLYATDPNWSAGVSAASGIGVNTPLDTSNSQQMSQLYSGIIQQETGMTPSQLGIDTNPSSSDYLANTQLSTNPAAFDGLEHYDANAAGFGLSGPQSTYQGMTAPIVTSNDPAYQGGITAYPGSGIDESAADGPQSYSGPQVSSAGTSLQFAPDTTSSGDVGAGGGGGMPIDIVNAPSVGTQAASTISSAASGAANTIGQSVQKGTQQLGSSISNSTQAGIQAGGSWIDALLSGGTDFLIRCGLILIALVILAGAWIFYSADKDKTIVVPI